MKTQLVAPLAYGQYLIILNFEGTNFGSATGLSHDVFDAGGLTIHLYIVQISARTLPSIKQRHFVTSLKE